MVFGVSGFGCQLSGRECFGFLARALEEALASESIGSLEGSVSRFWDCFGGISVLFRFWNCSVFGTVSFLIVPFSALFNSPVFGTVLELEG